MPDNLNRTSYETSNKTGGVNKHPSEIQKLLRVTSSTSEFGNSLSTLRHSML
eukprot:c31532_g1_i1 orf=2-154(-)